MLAGDAARPRPVRRKLRPEFLRVHNRVLARAGSAVHIRMVGFIVEVGVVVVCGTWGGPSLCLSQRCVFVWPPTSGARGGVIVRGPGRCGKPQYCVQSFLAPEGWWVVVKACRVRG